MTGGFAPVVFMLVVLAPVVAASSADCARRLFVFFVIAPFPTGPDAYPMHMVQMATG